MLVNGTKLLQRKSVSLPRPMSGTLGLFFLFILLIAVSGNSLAQKDSTKVEAKWGIDNLYTGMTVSESSVYGFQITYTTKYHSLALGPHILYHDLFAGQSDWGRFGAQLTYSYFPIGSNRLFSPFLFYDLNYSFIKAKRPVTLTAEDGITTYGATRQVVTNALAHHFGIGTRINIYKRLFFYLGLGAGVATFGDVITNKSLQSGFSDTKEKEHIFSNWEPAYMFRIGIGYQIGADKLKKIANCCD